MSQANPTDVEATKYAESYILYGDKTKAFRNAFPNSEATKESQHTKAGELHNTGAVQLRIDQLRDGIQGNALEEALFTAEQAIKEYEEARQLAQETENPAAMNGSTTGKAKIAGLLIDKIQAEVKETDNFEDYATRRGG